MTEVCSVRLVADVPACIPTIANWYKTEWSAWFHETPQHEIESDFRSVANRDCLPLALTAIDERALVLGACSVRNDVFEPYLPGGPWLRGLYVHTPFRRRGIAEQLVRAACEHAARLQLHKLFAATHSAMSTFERAGWQGIDQVRHEGQTLTIFARKIA
jgi:GNAT superfamily N-acetyltransferase